MFSICFLLLIFIPSSLSWSGLIMMTVHFVYGLAAVVCLFWTNNQLDIFFILMTSFVVMMFFSTTFHKLSPIALQVHPPVFQMISLILAQRCPPFFAKHAHDSSVFPFFPAFQLLWLVLHILTSNFPTIYCFICWLLIILLLLYVLSFYIPLCCFANKGSSYLIFFFVSILSKLESALHQVHKHPGQLCKPS